MNTLSYSMREPRAAADSAVSGVSDTGMGVTGMNVTGMSVTGGIVTGSTFAADKADPTLKDLLEDGVYLLFLLRAQNAPTSAADFNRRIDQYLATFDRVCHTFGKSLTAVQQAKYAFCALLDEIVLSSGLTIREEWEASPLQLRLFGEHLAGEGFFDRLEILRREPAANIELLEVFHTCLVLGFQGRYLLEGTEKLNYLTARLGQEIASVRGPGRGFAPSWKLPLKFSEYVRHELPMWLVWALLVMAGITVFVSCQWLLDTRMTAFIDANPPITSPIETTDPIENSVGSDA